MTSEEDEQARRAEAWVNRELDRLAEAIDAGDRAAIEVFTRGLGAARFPGRAGGATARG